MTQPFWYEFNIANSDFSEIKARVFMGKMIDRFAADGWERHPSGATIYQLVTPAGDHIYYISPEMASVATDVLHKFGARPCTQVPDLMKTSATVVLS